MDIEVARLTSIHSRFPKDDHDVLEAMDDRFWETASAQCRFRTAGPGTQKESQASPQYSRAGSHAARPLLFRSLHRTMRHGAADEAPLHEPGSLVDSRIATQPLLRFRGGLPAGLDLVERAYRRGRVLVESNNRLTLFAPALSHIFSKSKFIHLVRHPGDVARSLLRRDYYEDNKARDFRLEPRPGDPAGESWNRMSRIEKVAWFWNVIQSFAEDFKQEVGSDRVLTIRSEDLYTSTDAVRAIFRFLEVDASVSERRLAKMLRRPVNAQRTGNLPPFGDWSPADQDALWRHATMAPRYGYHCDRRAKAA